MSRPTQFMRHWLCLLVIALRVGLGEVTDSSQQDGSPLAEDNVCKGSSTQQIDVPDDLVVSRNFTIHFNGTHFVFHWTRPELKHPVNEQELRLYCLSYELRLEGAARVSGGRDVTPKTVVINHAVPGNETRAVYASFHPPLSPSSAAGDQPRVESVEATLKACFPKGTPSSSLLCIQSATSKYSSPWATTSLHSTPATLDQPTVGSTQAKSIFSMPTENLPSVQPIPARTSHSTVYPNPSVLIPSTVTKVKTTRQPATYKVVGLATLPYQADLSGVTKPDDCHDVSNCSLCPCNITRCTMSASGRRTGNLSICYCDSILSNTVPGCCAIPAICHPKPVDGYPSNPSSSGPLTTGVHARLSLVSLIIIGVIGVSMLTVLLGVIVYRRSVTRSKMRRRAANFWTIQVQVRQNNQSNSDNPFSHHPLAHSSTAPQEPSVEFSASSGFKDDTCLIGADFNNATLAFADEENPYKSLTLT